MHIRDTTNKPRRKIWCFPKKHGLHFAALDGPILIGKEAVLSIDHPGGIVRIAVLSIALCVLAACAPYKQDPSADTSYYDSRTSTGSNIPKKGNATVVDKSALEDQLGRQGGIPARP